MAFRPIPWLRRVWHRFRPSSSSSSLEHSSGENRRELGWTPPDSFHRYDMAQNFMKKFKDLIKTKPFRIYLQWSLILTYQEFFTKVLYCVRLPRDQYYSFCRMSSVYSVPSFPQCLRLQIIDEHWKQNEFLEVKIDDCKNWLKNEDKEQIIPLSLICGFKFGQGLIKKKRRQNVWLERNTTSVQKFLRSVFFLVKIKISVTKPFNRSTGFLQVQSKDFWKYRYNFTALMLLFNASRGSYTAMLWTWYGRRQRYD